MCCLATVVILVAAFFFVTHLLICKIRCTLPSCVKYNSLVRIFVVIFVVNGQSANS